MTNPVLVELWRGPLLESRHRGIVAVADTSGRLVLELGDTASPVFPRSAVKALQALPLVESGAADRYGFGAPELALACASHTGMTQHVETAARMLSRAGIDPLALGCGAHAPLHAASAAALRAVGERPSELHNNCSGKHAGMLATARHLGEPLQDYWQSQHPVQLRIKRTIEQLCGLKLDDGVAGIDGCSVPNWAIPTAALATAFARFASAPVGSPAHRLMQAAWASPEMVGGEGRLDTRVLAAAPGEIFLKTGAEGVYCAGLPKLGLGVAVKIDDGASRASELVIMSILATLCPRVKPLEPAAELKNWKGLDVGRMTLAAPGAASLAGLASLA